MSSFKFSNKIMTLSSDNTENTQKDKMMNEAIFSDLSSIMDASPIEIKAFNAHNSQTPIQKSRIPVRKKGNNEPKNIDDLLDKVALLTIEHKNQILDCP